MNNGGVFNKDKQRSGEVGLERGDTSTQDRRKERERERREVRDEKWGTRSEEESYPSSSNTSFQSYQDDYHVLHVPPLDLRAGWSALVGCSSKYNPLPSLYLLLLLTSLFI